MKMDRKELIIFTASGIIFAAFGWFLSVGPVLSKLALVRQQALTTQMRSDLISEVQKLQLKYQSVSGLLTGEITQHDFIAKISTLANEGGIKFESLVPSTELKESYKKLVLNLKTKARFLTLIKFFEKLDEIKPPVIISGMSIVNKSGYSRENLENEVPEVELTLETYLKKERGAFLT